LKLAVNRKWANSKELKYSNRVDESENLIHFEELSIETSNEFEIKRIIGANANVDEGKQTKKLITQVKNVHLFQQNSLQQGQLFFTI
jgi:hypothetical protein